MGQNDDVLASLVKEVASFPETPMAGRMAYRILEEGFYDEHGVRYDQTVLRNAQNLAGLAVLTRDMHSYLVQAPRNDASDFQSVVASVITEERQHWGLGAFPDYNRPDAGMLPEIGLALAAAQGRPTVTPLGEPRIVHEWTVKPGWRIFIGFFPEFASSNPSLTRFPRFKKAICGKRGIYERYKRPGLLSKLIAGQVVTKIFVAATLWYALSALLAVLLVEAGLDRYCGKKSEV